MKQYFSKILFATILCVLAIITMSSCMHTFIVLIKLITKFTTACVFEPYFMIVKAPIEYYDKEQPYFQK